jgi:hypothetical protein
MKKKNHLAQQVSEFVKKVGYIKDDIIEILVNRQCRPSEQSKEMQYLIKHGMVDRHRGGTRTSKWTSYRLNNKGKAFIFRSGVYDVQYKINKYRRELLCVPNV